MHGTNRDPWFGLRGNLLLQSLTAHDAVTLAPHLRRVHLTAGERLDVADTDAALIYFPETAILCLGVPGTREGHEIGLVGREGVIGWDALFRSDSNRHCARSQLTGTALAIPVTTVRAICVTRATLSEALMRFGLVFAVQVAATLVSNLHDGHARRIARWLLMFHDRLEGDDLALTHDALAALLHVRRATVTDALHVLEGDRMVRCSRGHVAIRDRAALEACAAHAYGSPERTYRAAIGAFGKSS